MKTNFFAATASLLIALPSWANQTTGIKIEGLWLTNDKDAHVKIIQEKDKTYSGRIVWMKEPCDKKTGGPLIDTENPDEKLKNRPMDGMLFLQGFKQDEEILRGGTVYDPNDGSTYKSKIALEDKNTLRLRGYVGIPLFGKSVLWTRVKAETKLVQKSCKPTKIPTKAEVRPKKPPANTSEG